MAQDYHPGRLAWRVIEMVLEDFLDIYLFFKWENTDEEKETLLRSQLHSGFHSFILWFAVAVVLGYLN